MTGPSGVPIFAPTLLLSADGIGCTRKWIQVAKTGSFVSQRYGKFAITRADLQQMLHNFRTITPIAPTQLPVDYDHLSMDPKQVGDGKAAGWFAGAMELRDGGNSLWAEVEFTEPAAQSIRHKEYRFISPSFVKDYVWKNGQNIGTTLIAAAITNHPFLEGMSAITLSNGLGEMAVSLNERTNMTPGQRVAITTGSQEFPSRPGQTFEVIEVRGAGDQALAKLKDETGTLIGWVPVSQLEPAPAVVDAAATLLTLATRRVHEQPHLSLRDALKQVAGEYPASADQYVLGGRERLQRNDAGHGLLALARERAEERQIPFGDAIRDIFTEQADLAARYLSDSRR